MTKRELMYEHVAVAKVIFGCNKTLACRQKCTKCYAWKDEAIINLPDYENFNCLDWLASLIDKVVDSDTISVS